MEKMIGKVNKEEKMILWPLLDQEFLPMVLFLFVVRTNHNFQTIHSLPIQDAKHTSLIKGNVWLAVSTEYQWELAIVAEQTFYA